MVTLTCKSVHTIALKLYGLQVAEQNPNPEKPDPVGDFLFLYLCFLTSQSNAVSNTKAKHSIAKLSGHGRLLGVAGAGQVDRGRFRNGDLETGSWLIDLSWWNG